MCSSTWMSHRWLCLILVELHKRRSRFVSSLPRKLFQILVSTTWYLFNLLLLQHFASLRETLCLISVQLHKMRLDFLFVLANSYFILVFSWKVSTGLHPHDRVVCFEMLCYCIGTVLNKCWIDSFFPSIKTWISIQLVAIATFCFATRNTYVLRVFCAVQLECHTGDFA